ncbi:hydroxyacid dehydrogenase [Aureimonas leprariae]|uniref:Hydroxyacid dehydrogenase n=1 Tax=Plantimonas leprariae TaxID=2615207 RepID=A0A7V7TXH8_9HYPH|nr:hydroxyacid dehydrogenase [Aureimonas leprariae]KAB0681356.1 hydroxyacid dehydrogenase [Aureimonas leprariae]
MTALPRPRVLIVMDAGKTEHVLPPALIGRLARVAELVDAEPVADFTSPALRERLGRVDVLLTGWGCPPVGRAELTFMPGLKLLAHAAGTVKTFVSEAVFEAGVLVSSAAEANARPVAQFTLALILLSAKRAFAFSHAYRRDRDRRATAPMMDEPIGASGCTVGLVGASRIGRGVLALLRPFDFEILLADPFVSPAEAVRLGARLVALPELLARSRIVSLHAPSLPETRGMIDRAALARMPDGATLINTARGALVDEAALLAELESGRLSAAIDVTDPEVPPPDSRLYDLPNVFLTPHIAGAIGLERTRLGAMAVAEIERFARGEPLRHRILPADLAVIA